MEEFDLTEYLANRFTIAGLPGEFRNKISQLVD